MKLIKINYDEIKNYESIFNLYVEAFPESERKPLNLLYKMIAEQSDMYFTVIEFEGEIVGLFIYWDLGGFYFVEHFAIFEYMRNRKIGQYLLTYIKEELNKDIILEVEHPITEDAIRRIAFYERNGFHIIDKDYMYPSYTELQVEYPAYLMSNNRERDFSFIAKYIEKIREEVYLNNLFG